MADVKCPHCGSPYCNLEKKEDSFQETMRYYYCNECKQRLRTVYKKPAASDTWLLTFIISFPRGEVEFYRNPDSSIYYRKNLSIMMKSMIDTSRLNLAHIPPPQ